MNQNKEKEIKQIKWETMIIATRNKGKVKEFRRLLSSFANKIITLDEFPDIPEVVEDGLTFAENARKKAEVISAYTNLPTIADDSGLVVDALEGKPGVFSARYAGEKASDQENNQKLLHELTGVPFEKRTARFVSHIALAIPNENTIGVEDTVEGYILEEFRGDNGFGYDPLFYLPTYKKTMAEIEIEIKNQISHRGKAMVRLVKWLEEKNSKTPLT